MINGHGDDARLYPSIRVNFAQGVAQQPRLPALYTHLAEHLSLLSDYPEPDAATVEHRIARHLGVLPANVLATAGATAAIYLIAQAHRGARSAILQPTFAEYADACRMHAHTLRHIYHPEDLPSDADLLWVCNPNNPTGQVWNTLPEAPLLVCDHSYEAFTEQPLMTAAEAVDRGNVFIVGSLTKTFGVPGLRIGYVVGAAPLIQRLRPFRQPWTLGGLAAVAVDYLLSHAQDFAVDPRAITRERERMSAALAAVAPITVWPSDSHLLLCQLRTGKAAALKHWLATEHGLLIRDASNFEGLSPAFFRIALQRPEQNDELLRALPLWFR